MLVTPSGISTEIKAVLLLKAPIPMEVTFGGITMLVMAHPSKALLPIDFNVEGKVIDSSLEQPQKV
jgi:hypothetical protein